MADRNWGLIQDGATFESLVRALIAFEDPSAILFGRAGRDGGQDAPSRDGTLVYQIKYSRDSDLGSATPSARDEARKIETYRVPNHPRCGQWKTKSRDWATKSRRQSRTASSERSSGRKRGRYGPISVRRCRYDGAS